MPASMARQSRPASMRCLSATGPRRSRPPLPRQHSAGVALLGIMAGRTPHASAHLDDDAVLSIVAMSTAPNSPSIILVRPRLRNSGLMSAPHAGMPPLSQQPALPPPASVKLAARRQTGVTPLRRADPAARHFAWLARAAAYAQMHFSHLDPASRAQLLSPAGPHVARAFTVPPTSPAVALPSGAFRCSGRGRLGRGRLDQLGDHRSACATSGVQHGRSAGCRPSEAPKTPGRPVHNLSGSGLR